MLCFLQITEVEASLHLIILNLKNTNEDNTLDFQTFF